MGNAIEEAQRELITALRENVKSAKDRIEELELARKYANIESRQWSDLAYQLRAENRKWVDPFCFNCGQGLRVKKCPVCIDLSQKPCSISDQPLAIPKANFCYNCGRDFRS